MDGGNSVSIEEKMDMLRRKIKDGALGADDARRALRAEIDGELRKAAADVDMDAVNACEALLAELSGAKEETHAAQNLRAIREKLHPQKRAPKRSAAVAALPQSVVPPLLVSMVRLGLGSRASTASSFVKSRKLNTPMEF